jgi:ArsR family transcriptional regulator
LRMAGLVTAQRDGRSMIYVAQFEKMNALLGFLTENCCDGAPCAPKTEFKTGCKPARKRAKVPA